MPVFKYEGTSPSGQAVNGVVEAFDEFEALEKARQQCRTVDSITQVRQMPSFLKAELGKGAFKPREIAIMCSQFSVVISAGMSSAKCVRLVAEQTANKNLAAVLREVAADVEGGHSLAESFTSKGGEKLPLVFYETIRAGEQAGTLEQSFEALHTYFDKRNKTKAKLAQALTYPLFVIVLAVVVVAVMMVAVIPTFKGILEGYGAEMPLMTQILINVSDFFSAYWMFMLVVVVVAIIAFRFWLKREDGRLKWERLKLKMPVVGAIWRMSNAAQYANTMSTLLGSGLHMTKAVEVTARVLDNYYLGKEVGKMTMKLQEGRSLGECMAQVPFLPQALTEMATVGEATGSIEDTLATMGQFYDEETDRASQRALSKLEPAILVFIAAFAGYVVIALYLAMFSIYSGM
ncbi:MAG: type II secretion system F family protein [Coriobacteriaceae bacterium]|nr:type II secretion system F family protein [Coriobacteriaceae bacterium]